MMELYRWTVIFISYNIIFAKDISTIECDFSSICSCTRILPELYEYHCTGYEPSVIIKVEPDHKWVDVQCTYDVDWDSKELPRLDFDYATRLSFLQCSLPTMSFSELMAKMKINNTKVLTFEYCSDCNNFTLTSDYFENLQNLQKLTLSRNEIEDIDKDAFKSLNELVELDLKFNKFLPTNGLFDNLQNLKLLDLSASDLTTLSSDLFKNLENLEVLYLWANKFTDVNSSIFKDLTRLNLLELSQNLIMNISEHAFYNLENLTTISLAGNKLVTLPENLFVNNRMLEKIFLNGNLDLIELPEGLFSNLTKVKSILLSGGKLKHLPERLFEGLINLQNLTLESNQIEFLPKDIFKDLKQLENLDLSFNQISDFPDEIFFGISNIKNLKLENNFLKYIPTLYFYYLKEMEVLNLKDNRISYIDVQAFRRASNLKEIVLSNNEFDLPKFPLFTGNLYLRKIDLSNNNITSIIDDFKISLLHLEELDLSYNQISYIQFSDLFTAASPIMINLAYNDIETVDFTYAETEARGQTVQDAISSNNGNRVVYLEGNPLVCDCGLYEFAQYFERIIDPMVPTLVDIDTHGLTCAAPSDYIGFPVKQLKSSKLTCSLQQLGIEDELTEENCSYGFRPWDKSLIVNCNDANLTEIPQLKYPKLDFFNQTEVYLQGNQLTTTPGKNMGYENVTKLFVSDNKIREVSWIPPKIKILELKNNNISYLNDSILSVLNKTTCTNITLGNNPWSCDCSVLNFINFLVSSNIRKKQVDINEIKCKRNGSHVVEVNVDEICPNYKTLIYVMGILFFSTALMVAILYALYYRFQQEIKVWLFAHNMCLWLVQEEELDKDKKYDAFISFSHKDQDFIIKELQPGLEHGPCPYKLCLHVRDWIAGEFISKQIVSSVADSRRTIVILSRNFLESEWGKMEFRTAHKQALQEGRARVILILYGDIDVNNDLDDEFKAYISTNTYVKWGDPWFWSKLRYALPHSRVQIQKRNQKHQNIMVAINEKLEKLDDKLDLINNSPVTPNLGSTPPVNVDTLLLKNSPLNFTQGCQDEALTPPAESGLNPLLVTVNK